jgi:hypothetical protein
MSLVPSPRESFVFQTDLCELLPQSVLWALV